MRKSKPKRILNNLKKHRKIMQYRQSDVAFLLDLHTTSRISRWEKGISFPNTVNLFKLSIIYRTFPNELYFNLLIVLRHALLKKEKSFLFKRRLK
jgi:transcriptional regulator with XRE-family HTH domain